MDIFMGLSIMQLEFGLSLLIFGVLGKKFAKSNNKKILLKKVKNQGIFNIILGIICGIIQYLNTELALISLLIFAVGVLFSVIYVAINVLISIRKSAMKNRNKVIGVISVILILTYLFLGDTISDKLKIGLRKIDEPITVGKEFLLYECNDLSHGSEKVFMTINNIEKDNGACVGGDDTTICTVMDFDLRYEGDNPIDLINENRSFSDLCSFTTNLSCDKLKDDDWFDDFTIEDDISSNVIHSEYTDKLPNVIKPGTILKNLTHPVAVMGVGYDKIPVEDINIEIETTFKMQHSGKQIRENINK